jgi:hypothetical protein
VLFHAYDTILFMATWHLAGSGNAPLHRACSNIIGHEPQEEYLVFLKISTKNASGIRRARSYRTLLEGPFQGTL